MVAGAGNGALSFRLHGREVPLRVRRNARARRMILRIDPDNAGVTVTLPPGVPHSEARRMVEDKAGWVATRLALLPEPIPFVEGAIVPYLGTDLEIAHLPHGRSAVRRVGDTIQVSGRTEHLPRRVRDWLRAEARREIATRARAMAATLGVPVGKIGVRDTRSRWGSCSAAGNLSFSWRLILAPEWVLGYVVAHEVAHLIEMNHGPRFWRLVATLMPDPDRARTWLRRHGEHLRRYG